MKRKLQTARAFSLHDWWTLAQSWLWLLVVDLALRVLPFPRVQAFAAPPVQSTRDPIPPAAIQRLRRFVDIAARHHLYPMTCLRQSLVLQRMLCARGVDARLRIGVRKDAGALEAHAWVEYGRTPNGEQATVEERFAPLTAVEANG